MIINKKSIVPEILIKTKISLDSYCNYYNNNLSNKDHFYILTEIETYYNDRARDMIIFYGLTEERFFPVYRWYIEESIKNGSVDIMA